jgi:hypothetical protein
VVGTLGVPTIAGFKDGRGEFFDTENYLGSQGMARHHSEFVPL